MPKFTDSKTRLLEPRDANMDKELFSRITHGDESAFREFFHLHYESLFTEAYFILKSRFWAEETVQEVFIQVWTNHAKLSEVDAPKAYINRMLLNKAVDRIRKLGVEAKWQDAITKWTHTTDAHSSDQTNERMDEADQLLVQAINTLPAQRKRIYQLKYYQRMSYEEIADNLSITKHTVRNQLAKALQSIRDFLKEHSHLLVIFISFLKK